MVTFITGKLQRGWKMRGIRPGFDYYPRMSAIKQLYYDNAITGIGKCVYCRKIIPKGTPILWFWGKFRKKVVSNPESINLNIKKKICFRCMEKEMEGILSRHQIEIQGVKLLRKRFRRSLKGKYCKRAIENSLVLDELQKEEWQKQN